jgi:hypothetical protein
MKHCVVLWYEHLPGVDGSISTFSNCLEKSGVTYELHIALTESSAFEARNFRVEGTKFPSLGERILAITSKRLTTGYDWQNARSKHRNAKVAQPRFRILRAFRRPMRSFLGSGLNQQFVDANPHSPRTWPALAGITIKKCITSRCITTSSISHVENCTSSGAYHD